MSETAFTVKNQSFPLRLQEFGRRAFRPAFAPAPFVLLLTAGADGTVTLQRVLAIGIEPALLHQAKRLDQPPAVGHGKLVGREGFGRRRANCPLIGLANRMGEFVLRDAGPPAALYQRVLGSDHGLGGIGRWLRLRLGERRTRGRVLQAISGGTADRRQERDDGSSERQALYFP